MAPVLTEGHQVAIETSDLQTQMIAYIKANFGDLLGSDASLLETPGGLDQLARKLHIRARSFFSKP